MFDDTLIRQLAAELQQSQRSRTPIEHFSKRHPGMSVEDGYRVGRAWVDLQKAEGRRVIGHKIGLTSRAMQISSQIDEPDYGTLLDDMLYTARAGEVLDIPVADFIAPRVEVELAFVLKDRLAGPDCTVFDVLRATEYVIPAIEIIDARIQQKDPETGVTRKVFDTISDNAANAGVVMGGRAVRPLDLELNRVSAVLYRNGVVEESGVAAAVLGDPLKGPAWLANKLHPHGVALEPGQVILGGSFTAPVPARAGDVFHVDYGPLGAFGFRFV